jgi:hypothetical protein
VEGREAISWCAACGNSLHASCCDSWAATRRRRGGAVSCVYCRTPWVDGSRPASAAAVAAAAGGDGGGGYVNLKAYSEGHRGVDTSFDALYPRTSGWIRHWSRRR